jgi:hypothetical protein
MKLAKTSLVLLAIQLVIVSSIAAKYLYQRQSCPRVWTRTVAYDPELMMRGRYLSFRMYVDGCGRIAPPERQKDDPMAINSQNFWYIINGSTDRYPSRFAVENHKLVAIPISGQVTKRGNYRASQGTSGGVTVLAIPGGSCDSLLIEDPVNFYIAEHATDPTPLKPGQELWIEVTVPPKGLPRPIQLALKQDGVWKQLAFQ